MTTDELNEYILHYLKNDKTQTAMMLTSEWGAGKSYYVGKKLVPYLNANNTTAIVVSLYGLTDIAMISKSIYMELRLPVFGKKKSEKVTAGKVVAKSVIKNITSLAGINLNVSEKDLKRIYESVNLKDKLLILEDVERSNIGIINILGYVNSLVERDGVKVLLIANEDEILKKEINNFKIRVTETPEYNGDEKNTISEDIQMYIRVKEKTISDTIYFTGEYEEAVAQIIKRFDNKRLNDLFVDDPDLIKFVTSLVCNTCKKNLRTFIFAMQKTVDIIDKIDKKDNIEYENSFFKCLLIGIIYFSSMIKIDEFPKWEGTQYLSTKLGSNDMPLMRFAYDYLRWQSFDGDSVYDTYKEYKDFVFFEMNAEYKDKDLKVLSGYYERTEKEVLIALKNIESKLSDIDAIGIKAYCKLAYYMIKVGGYIEFDYKKSLELMIKNARGRGDKFNVRDDNFFISMYEFDTIEMREEFRKFVKELSESVSYGNNNYNFSYNPEDIEKFYMDICRNKFKYIKNHKFISNLDTKMTLDMLKKSSSKQIDDFRGILFAVYRDSRKGEYDEEDVVTMGKLLEMIKMQDDVDKYWDKIQLMQIGWLKENIKEFIQNMS